MIKKTKLVKLNDVKISFPYLFQKKDWKNGKDPKYEITFMLNKVTNATEIQEIQDFIEEVLNENKIKKPIPASFKVCLKDGDLNDRQEYKDHYTILAKSTQKVPLLEKNPKIEVTDEKRFYGGCYVSAYIKLSTYENNAKGITAYLQSVQFRKDGERLGDVHDASNAYDSVDIDDVLDETEPDNDDIFG